MKAGVTFLHLLRLLRLLQVLRRELVVRLAHQVLRAVRAQVLRAVRAQVLRAVRVCCIVLVLLLHLRALVHQVVLFYPDIID